LTTTPVVTRTLVVANIVVFSIQLLSGAYAERLVQVFGYVPARLMNPQSYGYALWEVGVTLVTSLFLHGGFVHLFGNMIYLWTFGDAVESAMGHLRYFIFYVTFGAVGSLLHTVVFPHSPIP